MWFPSEAQRRAALFECAYHKYADTMVAYRRVPASREVVIEEARRHPRFDAVTLLYDKMARLTP